MLQQILAILLVLGLLAGTLVLLKRRGFAHFSLPPRGPSAATREIQLLERMPLGPQHALYLVKVRDLVLLIGVSPTSCSRLESLTDKSAADVQEFR